MSARPARSGFAPSCFAGARFDPAIGRGFRAGLALERALDALAGGSGELLEHAERAWRSITFAGSRHRIALGFYGESAIAGAEALIAALPDHVFAIPGQLVAAAAVLDIDRRANPPRMVVTLEMLLLEE